MMKTEIYFLCSAIILALLSANLWLILKYFSLNEKIEKLEKQTHELNKKVFGWEANLGDNKDEKRLKYRAKSHLTGIILTPTGKYPVDILDISKTGALIQSAQQSLSLGDNYPIKFALESEKEYELSIKVVRVSKNDTSLYGVLFHDASVGTLRTISDYVARAAKDELKQDFDPYHV